LIAYLTYLSSVNDRGRDEVEPRKFEYDDGNDDMFLLSDV